MGLVRVKFRGLSTRMAWWGSRKITSMLAKLISRCFPWTSSWREIRICDVLSGYCMEFKNAKDNSLYNIDGT